MGLSLHILGKFMGSLIEMTGPKRGIAMNSPVLVEFDMRIKTGEKEEDDLTLIDGATDYCDLTIPSVSFTHRIHGNCGAVDITLARVYNAVEATIDVLVLKVQNGFNLSLSSFVFVGGSDQEIPLFRGTTAESCGLRRYVIAVKMDTWMQLKFKVGQNGSKNDHLERSCYFKANIHGCACQQIMLQHAALSVKVRWGYPCNLETIWAPRMMTAMSFKIIVTLNDWVIAMITSIMRSQM
ncbi:hypothetical protein TRIUR3_03401 [Triticum urartu]|uniref:DUF6598 domain-containing protein n=1 Tax=Triticum urartu TaxID=4572 RepID=M8AAC8_TRIUA|nr:hypothetical protein TRIUR3_03401 [Triticum urartu]